MTYEQCWERISPRIKNFMLATKASYPHNTQDDSLYENKADDYSWHLMIVNDVGTKLDISFTLIENYESGDENSEQENSGNLMLEMIEYGGTIIGMLSPYKYTDRCWCKFDDQEEFDRRLDMIFNHGPDLMMLIDEWLLEKH